MVLVLLWALLAGCGHSVDERVARFGKDPEGVTREVLAERDPVVQETLVMRLAEAWPGRTKALCDALDPRSSAFARCDRFNTRPHLWAVPSRTTASEPQGSGRRLRASSSPLAEPAQVTAEMPPACKAQDPRLAECVATEAGQAAAQGEVTRAVAWCSSLDESRLRQDCLFSAAERVSPGTDMYSKGFELCRQAGTYATQCEMHLVLRSSEHCLRAGRFVPDHYHACNEMAQAIRAHWSSMDPEAASLAMDRFWLRLSFDLFKDAARSDVSRLFTSLPDEARPHLHDQVARRVIGEPSPLKAAREVIRGDRELPLTIVEISTEGSWREDLPGEELIPAIFFLDVRTGRRPTDPDREIDLQLALATVAARGRPPRPELIAQDLESESSRVRWYAAVLLSELEPGNAALAALKDDPDRLVAQRARGR